MASIDNDDKASTRLFIGRLAEGTSSDELKSIFETFGEVVDVEVRGAFGFVSMATAAATEAAIAGASGWDLRGKRLVVEKAKPKGSIPRRFERNARDTSVKLFVTNVPDFKEDELKEIFSKHGKVISAEKHHQKREIAFVRMETYFSARKAIQALNRTKLQNSPHTAFVLLAVDNRVGGVPLSAFVDNGEIVKLFVGSLSPDCKEDDLALLFERHGPVHEAIVVEGKDYGFVKMLSLDHAQEAVRALNRREFKGRQLKVVFSDKNVILGHDGSPMPAVAAAAMAARRRAAMSMMPRIRGPSAVEPVIGWDRLPDIDFPHGSSREAPFESRSPFGFNRYDGQISSHYDSPISPFDIPRLRLPNTPPQGRREFFEARRTPRSPHEEREEDNDGRCRSPIRKKTNIVQIPREIPNELPPDLSRKGQETLFQHRQSESSVGGPRHGFGSSSASSSRDPSPGRISRDDSVWRRPDSDAYNPGYKESAGVSCYQREGPCQQEPYVVSYPLPLIQGRPPSMSYRAAVAASVPPKLKYY